MKSLMNRKYCHLQLGFLDGHTKTQTKESSMHWLFWVCKKVFFATYYAVLSITPWKPISSIGLFSKAGKDIAAIDHTFQILTWNTSNSSSWAPPDLTDSPHTGFSLSLPWLHMFAVNPPFGNLYTELRGMSRWLRHGKGKTLIFWHKKYFYSFGIGCVHVPWQNSKIQGASLRWFTY